jgi:hypothetical protein
MNIITSVLVICLPLPALFRMDKRRSEVSQLIFLILLGVMYGPTPSTVLSIRRRRS